jgi:hypothetical protein
MRVYKISRKEIEKRSANAMDIKHLCNGSRKNETRWHPLEHAQCRRGGETGGDAIRLKVHKTAQADCLRRVNGHLYSAVRCERRRGVYLSHSGAEDRPGWRAIAYARHLRTLHERCAKNRR